MKFLEFLAILIVVGLCLTFFQGCGTISLESCNKYVGPEKEECIKNIKWKQEQLRRQRMFDRFDRGSLR